MCALARGVVAQYARRVVLPLLVLAAGLAVAAQLVEHREVDVLQTLALVQAPILIRAFEQVAAVELHGEAQAFGLRGVETLARSPFNDGEGALKLLHVEPESDAGVELDPVRLDNEEAYGVAPALVVERGLQVPQSLPQVLLRLRGGASAPERVRQRLARVRAVSVKQKVAEKLLHLPALEALKVSFVAAD